MGLWVLHMNVKSFISLSSAGVTALRDGVLIGRGKRRPEPHRIPWSPGSRAGQANPIWADQGRGCSVGRSDLAPGSKQPIYELFTANPPTGQCGTKPAQPAACKPSDFVSCCSPGGRFVQTAPCWTQRPIPTPQPSEPSAPSHSLMEQNSRVIKLFCKTFICE